MCAFVRAFVCECMCLCVRAFACAFMCAVVRAFVRTCVCVFARGYVGVSTFLCVCSGMRSWCRACVCVRLLHEFVHAFECEFALRVPFVCAYVYYLCVRVFALTCT